MKPEEDGALIGGLMVGAVVVALCAISFFIGKKAGKGKEDR